jgi:hypothetical protein
VPKQNARANALIRRRDRLRRARQLWLAGLVIWGVVVGWVAFGLVNSLTADDAVWRDWLLVWLLPVAALAIGALVVQLRLRAVGAALVEVERGA